FTFHFVAAVGSLHSSPRKSLSKNTNSCRTSPNNGPVNIAPNSLISRLFTNRRLQPHSQSGAGSLRSTLRCFPQSSHHLIEPFQMLWLHQHRAQASHRATITAAPKGQVSKEPCRQLSDRQMQALARRRLKYSP